MTKFRITYRKKESFTKELEAESTAEAIASFKKEFLDTKEIIDVEELKQYEVEYQYTTYCKSIVSATSEEDAKNKVFYEDYNDIEDIGANEITSVKEITEDKN